MSSNEASALFDAYYYAHGCGMPYERNEQWLNFFHAIAARIIEDIRPTTVLDAGCAMGFLVEGFRRQGVEAFGVDLSDYAISQVHPEIQPHCRVGSVSEPFPQRYDLIVCIEVLEHMPTREAEQAIANFCRHSDDIIFSSTPFDYKEPTHFNVQPPEQWAEWFARHGFYRDVDFDASFITPWAVRFRRMSEPPHRMVRDYERRFWLLWKENTDLRALVSEMRGELAGVEQARASEAERARELSEHIEEIKRGRLLRALARLHQLRARLFPPGSRRERLLPRPLRHQ